MNKQFNKRIRIIVLSLLLLIVVSISFSFAYIRGGAKNNESISTVALKGGNINIRYENNSGEIIANDIVPGFEATKKFTITSEFGNRDYYTLGVWYTVALIIDKNEFDDNSIEYSISLDDTSNSDGLVLPNRENIGVPNASTSNRVIIGSGRFYSNNVSHTYKLKISYPYRRGNQSHEIGREFHAHIDIVNTDFIKLTFDLDDGEFNDLVLYNNSIDVPANSTFELPMPEKHNYVPAGWEIVGENVNLLNNIITTYDNNITLKALWENGIFEYTGSEQEFIANYPGYYKIEAWGAKGANYYSNVGGKGAYTSGIIYLNKGNKLYVYVGEEGINAGIDRGYGSYGFNGGSGGNYTCYNFNSGKGAYNFYGGGATDIRLLNGEWNDFESLKSRIMVAAGGAAANQNANGVPGGGILGKDGGSATGATQISSGGPKAGGFGYAAVPAKNATVCDNSIAVGAGSGYYGGGASNKTGTGIGLYSAGSGSSFVSGHSGCNAISEVSTSTNIIHTNQSEHYSGYVFTDTIIKAGDEEMPIHDGTGSTMIGNDGPGHVRIKYLHN